MLTELDLLRANFEKDMSENHKVNNFDRRSELEYESVYVQWAWAGYVHGAKYGFEKAKEILNVEFVDNRNI